MVCAHCNLEMATAEGCVEVPVSISTKTSRGGCCQMFDPVPWGGDIRCHDCNTQPGRFHHSGCSMEACPKCGGQLISCGCLD
jgi:hypothetical protein